MIPPGAASRPPLMVLSSCPAISLYLGINQRCRERRDGTERDREDVCYHTCVCVSSQVEDIKITEAEKGKLTCCQLDEIIYY